MATNQGKQGKQGGGSGRGFAGMDPDRQREIAREGGKAAHEKGTAHEFNSEEARAAGSKSHGGHGGAGGASASSSSGAAGGAGSPSRGGGSEQHAEAARASHKNEGGLKKPG